MSTLTLGARSVASRCLRPLVRRAALAYIALAEALDSPLVTRDAKLSRSRGHRAKIELLA